MADVTGAGIVSGELILSLSDGTILRCGYVQGPQGLAGPQGPVGATGRPGTDGNTLLHGAGVPTFDDGKDGDWYIDTKDYKLYGPKAAGTWGSGVALLPKDRGHQLPTGMRAQGSAAAGRFFAAGISGPSSGGVGATPATGGWDPILVNKKPIAKDVKSAVAQDATGLAFHVMLRMETADGCRYMEVVACRLDGTSTLCDYTISWELELGKTFDPKVTVEVLPAGLTLSIAPTKALTSVSGVVQYL